MRHILLPFLLCLPLLAGSDVGSNPLSQPGDNIPLSAEHIQFDDSFISSGLTNQQDLLEWIVTTRITTADLVDNSALNEVQDISLTEDALELSINGSSIALADLFTALDIEAIVSGAVSNVTASLNPEFSIDGWVITGQTLSVADYNGVGGESDVHQWYSDGIEISGADQTTYIVTPADEGKNITLKINGSSSNALKNFIPSDAGVEIWLDPASSLAGEPVNRGTALTPFTIAGDTPVMELFNGVPTYRVLGGTSFLQEAGEFPDLNNLTVIIAKHIVEVRADSSFRMNNTGGWERSQMHVPWNNGRVYFDVQTMSNRYNTNDNFIVDGDDLLVSYQNNPTTSYANVYSTSQQATPYENSKDFVTPAVAGRVQIGAGTNANLFDTIVSARELSVSARQKMEGYIMHKYNVANILPDTHPYKNIAP